MKDLENAMEEIDVFRNEVSQLETLSLQHPVNNDYCK